MTVKAAALEAIPVAAPTSAFARWYVLIGVSLALFSVSFGIPISLLADRLNRRNIIAVSLIAWSAMTMLCGLAASYWQLLVARIGGGVGEAGGTPAASSIISDYFPAGP